MRANLLNNNYFLKIIRDRYIKSSDTLDIDILYLVITKT